MLVRLFAFNITNAISHFEIFWDIENLPASLIKNISYLNVEYVAADSLRLS